MMFNVSDVCSAVNCAQMSTDANERLKANQYLDQVRSSQMAWHTGLSLFYQGNSDVSKFFGLSLARDFLRGRSNELNFEHLQEIRLSIISWVREAVASNDQAVNYLFKTSMNIIALLIKLEYPEKWENPFGELLEIGKLGFALRGVEFVMGVLNDIDAEIVQIHDKMDKTSFLQATKIKDAMRARRVTNELVSFLCVAAVRAKNQGQVHIASRCLQSLSRLIVWVDISLIVNNETLPLIYSGLRDEEIAAGACMCVQEMVKKGMASNHKLELIEKTDVISVLTDICNNLSNDLAEDVAPLIDTLFQEVQDIWADVEQSLRSEYREKQKNNDINSNSTNDMGLGSSSSSGKKGKSSKSKDKLDPLIRSVLVTKLTSVAFCMHSCISMSLTLFRHSDSDVSSSLVPSLNRFVQLLRSQANASPQSKTNNKISKNASTTASNENTGSSGNNHNNNNNNNRNRSRSNSNSNSYSTSAEVEEELSSAFCAAKYLPELLNAVYVQLQYPADFDFNMEDEDDSLELEFKKSVKKIFTNLVRVQPSTCLQLIVATLSSLPQPLNTAPFPTTEAALTLLLAYGDSGVGVGLANDAIGNHISSSGSSSIHNNTNGNGGSGGNEDLLPSILKALHGSGIGQHDHIHVRMKYFEICARYARILQSSDNETMSLLQTVIGCMLGTQGMRCSNEFVRARTVYFFMKLVEGLEVKAALMLSYVGSFADLLLCDLNRPSVLAPTAEIHLLDAVGTMCCHDVDLSIEGSNFLQNMIHLLIEQVAQLCAHVEKGYHNKINNTTATSDSLSTNSGSTGCSNINSIRHLVATTAEELDDVLVILAHKIDSLCSIARGHVAFRRSQVSNIFQQVCTVINQAISIPVCCAHGEVRNKCLSFYHRMVMMLKDNITDLSSHLWDVVKHILAFTNAQDIEQLIGLVHQIAHEITCIDIGSTSSTPTSSDLTSNNLIFTSTNVDNNTSVHKNQISLSSHIMHLSLYPIMCRICGLFVSVDDCQPIQVTQMERNNLEKLYLMLIQNCITDGCAITLTNSPCRDALELMHHLSSTDTNTSSTNTGGSLSPQSQSQSQSQQVSPHSQHSPNATSSTHAFSFGAINHMNDFILEYSQGGLQHVLSIAQAATSGQLLLTKSRAAEVIGDDSMSVNLRRLGCSIISSLINTSAMHAGQSHSINTPIYPLSQHHNQMRVLILEQALPTLLQCCSSLPNPRSGASQALYAEIGSLIWILCKTPNPHYTPNMQQQQQQQQQEQQIQSVNSSAVVITTTSTEEILLYLRDRLLPSFGWSTDLIASITGLIVDIGMKVAASPVQGQIAASSGAGEAQLRDKFKTLFCSLHGGK